MPLQSGRGGSASAARPASTCRPRSPGRACRAAVARRAGTSGPDGQALVGRATTSTCRSGQGDLPPTRSRWRWRTPAIANGGRGAAPAARPADRGLGGTANQQLEAPTARRCKIPTGTGRRSSRGSTAPRTRRAEPRRPSSRDSRSKSPERPEPPRRAPAGPTSHGTSRWRRAEPEVRRCGHRRGRRLRRRHRGADGAADPCRAARRATRPAGAGRRGAGLMAD